MSQRGKRRQVGKGRRRARGAGRRRAGNFRMSPSIRSAFANPRAIGGPIDVWKYSSMPYSEIFDTTLLPGTYIDYIFRANSLFDPDRTGTGHQPGDYDYFAAMYNRYVVYDFFAVAQFAPTNDVVEIAVGIVNGQQTYSTAADLIAFRQSPKTQKAMLPFGGGGVAPKIRSFRRLNNFGGMSLNRYLRDDIYTGVTTGNPSEVVDYHVLISNPSSVAVDVKWTVDFKYRSIFFDPFTPTYSFEEVQKRLGIMREAFALAQARKPAISYGVVKKNFVSNATPTSLMVTLAPQDVSLVGTTKSLFSGDKVTFRDPKSEESDDDDSDCCQEHDDVADLVRQVEPVVSDGRKICKEIILDDAVMRQICEQILAEKIKSLLV